jgi:hypothetical protein
MGKLLNRCTWTNEVRTWTHLQILFELLFCLAKVLNMLMVRNFDDVGTNSKPVCVEFCNFMQCNIFVNNFTC